jgi:hypothetical protein
MQCNEPNTKPNKGGAGRYGLTNIRNGLTGHSRGR